MQATVNINDISKTIRYYIPNFEGRVVSRIYIRFPSDPKKPLFLFRLKTNKRHRRKGLATEILNRALKDYNKFDIELSVNEMDKDAMTTEQLIEFYKRLGFKRKKINGKKMIRKGTNDKL